ncbi:MAG: hypothetical protein WC622_09065 [Pedobacter sp.]|jgi:hypothetical protein|uniref:hypothetical protein n=1 Tax=Pedobacter sp. TaxID=1411316 RepID=UPI0035683FDB
MTEDRNNTIEFKSPIRNWNDTLFIVLFALTALITLAILGLKINYLYPFIFTALGFTTYYLARYLTQSITVITITNNELVISQDSKRLNKQKQVDIELVNVRGFEIAEVTRGNKALFIYTNSSDCYKYTIVNSSDEFLLKKFLNKHLKLLNKKSNPLFDSFISAYIFALKKAFNFCILSAITIGTLYYITIKYNILPTANAPKIIILFLTALFFWWFTIRIPVKKHHFRFGAFYWFSNFFFYTSTFLFIPILLNMRAIKETPLHINRSYELFKHPVSNLLIIDQISYNPDSVRISSYTETYNRKGNSYTIEHQFATPLGGGDTIKKIGIYNLWLAKIYQQKTKKSIDFYEKIASFHRQSEAQFIKLFNQKPVFYKLLYTNDINNLINNSAIANKQNVALEPHWESLEAYKIGIQKQLILFVSIFVVFNLVGCIVVAVNR